MSRTHSVAAAGLALALLLATGTGAGAQEHLLGLKGGFNVANVSQSSTSGIDPLGNTSARSDFAGGLFAAFGLTDILGLQIEAVYTRNGIESDEPAEVSSAALSLDYLQFPVLLAARIPIDGTRLRPLVYAGPAVAFELRCEVSGTIETLTLSRDCDDPEFNVERTKTDFGLLFGAGIEVPVGAVVLGAEARYAVGLSNLNDDPLSEAEDKVRSRTWSFMASIGIPLHP